MSSSPSLKITLKLSGPKPQTSSTERSQTSSPASNKKVNARESHSSSENPRKRSRPNHGGRSRKLATPVLYSSLTVDDDGNEEAVNNSNRRSGGGGGGGGVGGLNIHNAGISRKDLLKYKDIKVRKWVTKPLVFYTLNGSEVKVPSWQSDEKMTINGNTTEPITVAEIDQLFSSTAGEKDFRPFLCTQPGCSKSFTTFDQLQTHETNMHGTKKLVCGIDGCHKSFVTTGQLTKHRKMVHFRAARKAKLAAAAAAAAAEANSTTAEMLGVDNKDEDAATPGTDSVDIANM